MKRKKYTEELETRLSDEEVKVIVKAKKSNTAASKEPSVQLFVVSHFQSILQKKSTIWEHFYHVGCRIVCSAHCTFVPEDKMCLLFELVQFISNCFILHSLFYFLIVESDDFNIFYMHLLPFSVLFKALLFDLFYMLSKN